MNNGRDRPPEARGPRQRHRPVPGAAVFLTLLILACFAGPLLMDASANHPSDATYQAPGAGAPFGTDANGRDLLYRVLSGGRVSMVIALCAAVVSLTIGTAAGMVSGFYGGKLDAGIMRTVDVLYALPRILFALVLIAVLDEPVRLLLGRWLAAADHAGHRGLKNLIESALPYSKTLVLIFCLGAVEWLTMARIARGQVLVMKERAFVEAARSLGLSPRRILFRHLLPNLWSVVLTYLMLTIPVVVLDESFLSFLGLGIEEPAASWGTLLKEGAEAINPVETRWWLPVFPAGVMVAMLLALNSLGDNLREALDVH